MLHKTQTISVYRNRKTGDLRIQPFGRLRNGSSQPFGEAVHLGNDVSNDWLLESIIENLAKNDQQTYSFELAPKVPKEEQQRRLREDQLISVDKLDSGFRLVPSERMGNSFGSIDEKVRTISSGEFLTSGGKLVRQLFDELD